MKKLEPYHYQQNSYQYKYKFYNIFNFYHKSSPRSHYSTNSSIFSTIPVAESELKINTRKVINHLKHFIGHEMLRTKPTACGDWSYTEHCPLLFIGFTSKGCIRCSRTGIDAKILGNDELVLPLHFTDYNWITYKKAITAKGNVLNKWQGKKIRRIRSTPMSSDRSFMSGAAPTLISASKYHMVVMYNDIGLEGTKSVLNSDYNNPDDWKLAE